MHDRLIHSDCNGSELWSGHLSSLSRSFCPIRGASACLWNEWMTCLGCPEENERMSFRNSCWFLGCKPPVFCVHLNCDGKIQTGGNMPSWNCGIEAHKTLKLQVCRRMGKNWPPWGCTVCREQNLVFMSHLGTQKICTRAAVVIYPCLSSDSDSVSSSDGTGYCSHMRLSSLRFVTLCSLVSLAVDVPWCLSLMFFHLWLFCNENVLVLLPSKHFDFYSKSFSKWFHIDCFYKG